MERMAERPASCDLLLRSTPFNNNYLFVYRKRLTMHEIERVAEESTSGREDGQRTHRGFASRWFQPVRMLKV